MPEVFDLPDETASLVGSGRAEAVEVQEFVPTEVPEPLPCLEGADVEVLGSQEVRQLLGSYSDLWDSDSDELLRSGTAE